MTKFDSTSHVPQETVNTAYVLENYKKSCGLFFMHRGMNIL